MIQFSSAGGQTFDPDWYNNDQPWIKLSVSSDDVYAFTGSELAAIGIDLSTIDATTFQVIYNGQEIPIWLNTASETFTTNDTIFFVGYRNTGEDETWGWRDVNRDRGSTFYSRYTDTANYWLTWSVTPGNRFEFKENIDILPEAAILTSFKDTLHFETDTRYYYGDDWYAGNPLYTHAEGWYDFRFSHSSAGTKSNDWTFVIPDADTGSVSLTSWFAGGTNSNHAIEMQVETNSGFVTLDNADWTTYNFGSASGSTELSTLPNISSLNVHINSIDDGSSASNHVWTDWFEAYYQRKLSIDNGALFFTGQSDEKTYQINNQNANSVQVINLSSNIRYQLTVAGNIAQFTDTMITPAAYLAFSADQIQSVATAEVVNSSAWANTNNQADYILITTPALLASAQNFADYRATQSSLVVKIVMLQDIFDQFDYGRPSPIAIRRFAHQTQSWTTKPQFLAFWGDAFYPERNRPLESWEVPSFGNASSDGWFVMQLNGEDDWIESMAVGRIPVRDNVAGALFLQKLDAYENAEKADWQKRVMLLAGGIGESQQNQLQVPTLFWGSIANDNPFGADTLQFFKQSDTALDPTFQDSLRVAIARGNGWISYFGHSAAFGWEIVTDPPDEFGNAGRLPIILSLGCNAGAFATSNDFDDNPAPVFAEQLVTGSENGAIAHWGGSSSSYISPSIRIGTPLYDLVFKDTVRTLGLALVETKRQFLANSVNSDLTLLHNLQYNLIGDPAMKLNLATKPDFAIQPADIRFNPIAPTPADSNLTALITLHNYGLVPVDSFSVSIQQTLPDASTNVITFKVAPFKQDTVISVNYRMKDFWTGNNAFQVTIDDNFKFEEENELNNQASTTLTIFANGLQIVSPANLSTVNTTTPNLTVTTQSLSSGGFEVVFEIDSVATFSSNFKVTTTKTMTDFVLTWTPTNPLPENQLLFWRVRPAGEENWVSGSFTVKTNLPAETWLQHQTGFNQNTQNDQLNRINNQWQFSTYNIGVTVSSESSSGPNKGQFTVNGLIYERLSFGFGLMIIDGTTGKIITHDSFITYNNSRGVDPITEKVRLDSLVSTIQPNNYVYVRTRNLSQSSGVSAIDEDVKDLFRSLGSAAIDTLTYDHLWNAHFHIGHTDETYELVEPPNGTNEINSEAAPQFNYSNGATTTPIIGPAKSWQSVQLEEALANDHSFILLNIINPFNQATLLENVSDLSSLDAKLYPWIQVEAVLNDTSQASTPQLTSLQVNYQPLAELALNPTTLLWAADTVSIGESQTVSLDLYNLGSQSSDSVIINWFLSDRDNVETLLKADTLLNFSAGGNLNISHTFTPNFGNNILRISAKHPHTDDLLASNNVLIRPFYVAPDDTAPELDILLEGVSQAHDPDPVTNLQDARYAFTATNPEIEINLSDFGSHLVIDDTSQFRIWLDGNEVFFNDANVEFTPADTANNTASIQFKPQLPAVDTVHTILVRAMDTAGNTLINNPYQVHFRTQPEISVASLYPYPNPMRNQTIFAFELRGADVTDITDCRIRIYTVAGRLVKVFNLLDNPEVLTEGQLHIGWNRVPWDTRDEDGNLLASGVYLYRVHLKTADKTYQINSNSGVEKLVIIR